MAQLFSLGSIHARMDDDTRYLIGLLAASCIVLTFGVGLLRFVRFRSRAILRKWADESGFEILERKQEFLVSGPFKWSSNNQTIFYLRVRGRDGCERSCWARCGSFFDGVLFSNKIEIRWNEP